jgi:hypothetical protein
VSVVALGAVVKKIHAPLPVTLRATWKLDSPGVVSVHSNCWLVAVTVPSFRLIGAGKHTALNALTRPNCQSEPVPAIGSAVPVMRLTTSDDVVNRQLACTSAARPATCGVAIEVPLQLAKAPIMPPWQALPPGTAVDQMAVPGAATSTHVPKFEVVLRASD